jgi:WD40 repeat protein
MSGGRDGTARLWDVRTGQQLRVLRAGDGRCAVSVVFLSGDQHVLSACDDGAVRRWHLADATELELDSLDIFAVSDSLVPTTNMDFDPWGNPGRPRCQTDGRRVAYCDVAGAVALWDLTTGVLICRLPTLPPPYVIDVTCVSPDRSVLATGYRLSWSDFRTWTSEISSREGFAVRLWDTTSGVEIAALHGHTAAVSTLASDPTGVLLASADLEGSIAIWNSRTGEQLRTLRGEGAGGAQRGRDR